MDRDPIFAFNSELPDVPSDHVVSVTVHQESCDDDPWMEAEYPNGTVHVQGCYHVCPLGLAPVTGEPALFHAEVIDEQGPPLAVGPADLVMIDNYLSFAMAGAPSLPAGTVVTPPASRPRVTGSRRIPGLGSTCAVGRRGSAWPLFFALAFASLWRILSHLSSKTGTARP